MRASFLLGAALLLTACQIKVLGANGDLAQGAGGATGDGTASAGGAGGAVAVYGGAGGGSVGGAAPAPCASPFLELTAVVPAAVLQGGGSLELTTLPDPDSSNPAGLSRSTTTTTAIAAGTSSVQVHTAGPSLLAVAFLDAGGAFVDAALLSPFVQPTEPWASTTRHVPAQYPTIQAAIDAADPGDTVLVAPGTYTERVSLRSGVHLQGSGAGQTTLDGLGQGLPIVAASNAAGASVRGFRFLHAGANTACANGDVFECSGEYQPAAVHAVASSYACVPDTTLLVADNVFEDNHLAVMIGWGAHAILRHNLFRQNEHALAVNHGADNHLLVRENVFQGNGRAVEGDATYLFADHNVLAGNGVALRHMHIQTAPPRCNAFAGNAENYLEGFDTPAPAVLGVDGNTSFDGPADVASAIAAGCFPPGTDPATVGLASFAGTFGESILP